MKMSYEEARGVIEDGDIVFVREKMSLARPIRSLIMFFTNSHYIHVGIAFWVRVCGHNHLMIAEAQGGAKRRIINMSYYQKRKMDVVTSPAEWNATCEKAIANLGVVDYGWLDAIYVGIKEKLSTFISLPEKDFPGEICSEFVARLLELEKVNVSPQRLYEILMKDGQSLKLMIR